MEVIREMVHISDVKVGDCIEHQGKLMTVCRSAIKRGFMGITIFGDSYRLGNVDVVRANPIHIFPMLESRNRRPE